MFLQIGKISTTEQGGAWKKIEAKTVVAMRIGRWIDKYYYNNIAAIMIIPNKNTISLNELFKSFSACFFSEGNGVSSILYSIHRTKKMEIMLPS